MLEALITYSGVPPRPGRAFQPTAITRTQHFTYIESFLSSFSWAFVVSHFCPEAGYIIKTVLCVPLRTLFLSTKTKLLILVSSFGIWSEKQLCCITTYAPFLRKPSRRKQISADRLPSILIKVSPLIKEEISTFQAVLQ